MTPARFRSMVRWIGLVGGPAGAWLAYHALPDTFRDASGTAVAFTPEGRATLAVMVWMAAWWLTEAIDISATALLPLAVFPLLGVAGMGDTAAPYANELIFLFMGGFMLALSMQRWGLDRRIALLTLRLVGTRPANMVAGFMAATAVLSAFVSNTATAAMMLPIAMSVIGLVGGGGRNGRDGRDGIDPAAGRHANFAPCLLLSIAYAASIGGVATIIGTPPNVFLVGFIRDSLPEAYRQDISFVRWIGIGGPLAAVFLPITWLLLTRVLHPVGRERIEGGATFVRQAYRELGRAKRGEWLTFIAFSLTATAWILRPIVLPGMTDAGIVMCTALLLFVLPVEPARGEFVLDWKTAQRLPWGILILFGGGLSLAAAVKANGVAEFFGSIAVELHGVPPLVLILVVTTVVIFLTELTSNTATTAALVPILAAVAPGLDLHPFALIVPAAIAASCAFMMPVATPPNAIVFGSGHLSIPQMCRAGIWLNLIAVVLITTLLYAIMIPLLGVSMRLSG